MYRIIFLILLTLPFLAQTNACTLSNCANKNISISFSPIVKDTLNPQLTEDIQKRKQILRTSSNLSFISGWLSVIFTVLVYVLFQTASVSTLGVLLLCFAGSLMAALFALIFSAIFFTNKNKHPKLTFRNDLSGVGLFLAILSMVSYVITIALLFI